jgi:hypothetical protein
VRIVPQAMTDAWKAEDKTTDDRRPTVRATIQMVNLKRHGYWDNNMPGLGFVGQRGTYTNILMGHHAPVAEIRNIVSFSWNRSVNQDMAEATMVIRNTDLTPLGNADEHDLNGDFDRPGQFTYNRGSTMFPGQGSPQPNPWGFTDETGWADLLVPDRMVKTYEGYGSNPVVVPGRDDNLLQSGTWLIQSVDYGSDKTITLHMKDLASILQKQIVFPPVIPKQRYPLSWEKIHTANVDGRDAKGGSWKKLTTRMGSASSSNKAYVGAGLTNRPYPSYVRADGSVNGHHPSHVLYKSDSAYWLSTGQDAHMNMVWWQFNFAHRQNIAGLRIKPYSGPYRIFISLWDDVKNKWVGQKNISQFREADPTGDIDNHSTGIRHIGAWSVQADDNAAADYIFARKWSNITKMRLTFYRLREMIGEHPFYAGLRSASVYTGDYDSLHFGPGQKLRTVGNYHDYTDIVKWACAWGGFYWPSNRVGDNFIKLGAGDLVYLPRTNPDPALSTNAAVWGDFMNSGTAGVATLTMDLFDKQPLLDMIAYVRDLLGFIFFVDETGGIIWRMPNLWSLGNYTTPTDIAPRADPGIVSGPARTNQIVTIDERETLISLTTTLDSSNLRERIFVGSTTGKYGATIKGFNPYDVDFRRVAGWTDQNFKTKRECLVMADMVATQSMFSYHKTKVTIPGYPAIQVDDQVRLLERVTNETFYHYVESVSSSLDMSTGEWTYELETHWLGEKPSDAWAVQQQDLHNDTKLFLAAVGSI